jgi:hypothetical protein
LSALEQRTVDETERVLLSVTKESLSHLESSQPHQTVRKAVDNLVQDMKDKGLEVEDVSKGSIVFTIKCQSFEGLIALIDYFDSPINNHLDAISRALSELTGQKIEVHAMILTDRLSEELRRHESKYIKLTECISYEFYFCKEVVCTHHEIILDKNEHGKDIKDHEM